MSVITLPTPETKVPAYIPCHPKDIPTLPFCVASLRRHPQITTISVIAPSSVAPTCAELGVEFLDEESLLAHWFPADIDDRDSRWYYQMFLKLSVAFQGEGAPDRYLIIDADTIFLHDFPLVDDASGTVLHPRMERHDVPYFTGMRELFGHDVPYEGSYVSHFMIYRSPIIREMFAEFARVRGRPDAEGLTVLREFLQRCDRHHLSFADYETYGYYAREYFPNELRWVQRRQLNVLYVAPSERVLRLLRPYYDYASFHAYRQPDRRALKIAGTTWLTSRLARDRIGRRHAVFQGD